MPKGWARSPTCRRSTSFARKLIGLVQAPASKIARVVNAPGSPLARVFAAYGKTGEAA